ncbi:zinc finger MYM-type protein 5-like [Daktulosphaira vitifoliae]|uniref:zinc finger MYM-type protein 5-like n=1 Tax=Daktulosphaira vitifoliae TaxID=58002 RepID=UPI0021A99BFA|nr:zinc finger MYM-type protein 5-like [Daktulosphaira vitifoliae]
MKKRLKIAKEEVAKLRRLLEAAQKKAPQQQEGPPPPDIEMPEQASTSGVCSSNSSNIMDINMKKTDFQVSDSETTIISESIEVDNVEPEGSCESNELTNMIVNETILEIDPAKWVINDEFRDYIAKNGFNQNMTNDFINSKRIYSDKTRYLTKIMFNRRLINGETIVRSWLVYSPSLGVVFCGPCRIF